MFTAHFTDLGKVFRNLGIQAEDGIRDSVASRGLGDVYKRQNKHSVSVLNLHIQNPVSNNIINQKTLGLPLITI